MSQSTLDKDCKCTVLVQRLPYIIISRIELFFFSELIIMVLEDINNKCEYYMDQVLFLTEVIKNS